MSPKTDASAWRIRLKKFKGLEWIALVVLIGIAGSIALSDFGGAAGGQSGSASPGSALETRLASILSSIDGAGMVEVMIYEAASAASSSYDWLGGAYGGGEGSRQAVGVVVVADGAGDVRVRLELVRAVQTLMDLPASAVEVFQRGSAPT
ncbi:MAG: hypothetical protein LBH66_05230 [Oscillospiraceae bacterium]|jgi:stage III sporulation protein AG|nr:hypothetical protein [Oscillospiraceae bacterium]